MIVPGERAPALTPPPVPPPGSGAAVLRGGAGAALPGGCRDAVPGEGHVLLVLEAALEARSWAALRG